MAGQSVARHVGAAESTLSGKDIRRVEHLLDLGTMDLVPVGTRVRVTEDSITYTGVGAIDPAIARRIEHTPQNIWIPEHVSQRIERRRLPFENVILMASMLIKQPMSVHYDVRQHDHVYFIVDADLARNKGLLHSRSTRYVDAVVELRQVSGGSIARMIHLAPRKRNHGGMQIWP